MRSDPACLSAGGCHFAMENGSTNGQAAPILNGDGGKNRESQATGRVDALCEGAGFCPSDVASRVFGSDPAGPACLQGDRSSISRSECTRNEREAIVSAGFLPQLVFPKTIEARGTEHVVRFQGRLVEKHQHADGWVPVVTSKGKLGLDRALPTEYLRRLELQNVLFGDGIKILGLTRGGRFAISQSTLRGGEPTENEIRDVLNGAGWRRIPIDIQDLPPQLMGSAWWHKEEEVVLLDARKPNFKKTAYGVLPIDLVLADLTPEMRNLVE